MLESIRKRKSSLLVLLAFGAIIIVFMFWGIGPTGNGGGNGQDIVARVDGQPIYTRDYSRVYKQQLEYYRRTFKGQFTSEMAEKMNLKQSSLDFLINRALVLGAASEAGVSVTKEEVQAAIMEMEVFQKNGAFDQDLYYQVLSANRIKPAEFEQSIEQDIIANKMQSRVVADITVTDQEVREAYLKENRKIDLEYAAYDAMKLKSEMEVTEEEARKYLEINSSEFMVPKKVKAFYVYADFNQLASSAEVSPEEVREYYEANTPQFEIPAKAKASHILVRPDPEHPDQEAARAEARQKAEDILRRLDAGEDFSELARQYSDDPGSSGKGGDLGWFSRGVMVKQFEDAAFGLEKGRTSGLVETPFGFHIIKVVDKKPAEVAPLDKVEPQITKILSWQKGQTRAKEVIDSLAKPLGEAEDIDALKKAAAGKPVTSVTTPLFSEKSAPEEVTEERDLLDVIMYLREGEVSEPLKTPERIYLVKLLEEHDAHVPEFSEIKDDVFEAVRRKKAVEEALKRSENLLERVGAGEVELREAARLDSMEYGTTGFFTKKEGFMPKVGVFIGDKDGLFLLPKDKPVYPDVVPHEGKFFVFKLRRAEAADPSELKSSTRAEIRGALMAAKQREAVEKWLDGLREDAEVEIRQDLL